MMVDPLKMQLGLPARVDVSEDEVAAGSFLFFLFFFAQVQQGDQLLILAVADTFCC